MTRPLSRRQFLAIGGGVALTGSLAACASPMVTSITGGQPDPANVIFWHLFGGGDGIVTTPIGGGPGGI